MIILALIIRLPSCGKNFFIFQQLHFFSRVSRKIVKRVGNKFSAHRLSSTVLLVSCAESFVSEEGGISLVFIGVSRAAHGFPSQGYYVATYGEGVRG
jgi:hypothetical protein